MNGSTITFSCSNCGEIVANHHTGPCPECGQVGKSIAASVPELENISERESRQIRREFFEKNRVLLVAVMAITLASTLFGLIFAGVIGFVIGLVLSVVALLLGFRAVVKVIKIQKG